MTKRTGRWAAGAAAALLIGAALLLTVRSGHGDDQRRGLAAEEPTLYAAECGAGQPACGDWCSPSAAYACCRQEDDAPPESCVSSAYDCYRGGGAFTGWPKYNGCNPRPSGCGGERPKHCPGKRRSTCCPTDATCDASFGVAFCADPSCPEDRRCNGGRLCCSAPGLCRDFLNVEYCAEDCAAQGAERCELIGSWYGEQEIHFCCPTGSCRHHPDGWPFCAGEVK